MKITAYSGVSLGYPGMYQAPGGSRFDAVECRTFHLNVGDFKDDLRSMAPDGFLAFHAGCAPFESQACADIAHEFAQWDGHAARQGGEFYHVFLTWRKIFEFAAREGMVDYE